MANEIIRIVSADKSRPFLLLMEEIDNRGIHVLAKLLSQARGEQVQVAEAVRGGFVGGGRLLNLAIFAGGGWDLERRRYKKAAKKLWRNSACLSVTARKPGLPAVIVSVAHITAFLAKKQPGEEQWSTKWLWRAAAFRKYVVTATGSRQYVPKGTHRRYHVCKPISVSSQNAPKYQKCGTGIKLAENKKL